MVEVRVIYSRVNNRSAFGRLEPVFQENEGQPVPYKPRRAHVSTSLLTCCRNTRNFLSHTLHSNTNLRVSYKDGGISTRHHLPAIFSPSDNNVTKAKPFVTGSVLRLCRYRYIRDSFVVVMWLYSNAVQKKLANRFRLGSRWTEPTRIPNQWRARNTSRHQSTFPSLGMKVNCKGKSVFYPFSAKYE